MNSRSEYPRRFVKTAHGRFAVVQRGSGPPLVLLHGIPLSSLTWRRNIEALARDFSVTAIDLKGFGYSTSGTSDFSPAGHAEAIRSVLDELEVQRASVAANSYGGAVAAWLASTYPRRVERLILVGSIGTGAGRHHLERILRIGMASACARPLLSSRFGRHVVSTRLFAAYGTRPRDVGELAAEYHRPLREAGGAIAFLESLRSLDERALMLHLAALPHATLLVWGGRDRIVPARAGFRLRTEMRAARLEVFEQSGHFPHEEEPERFNAIAAEFLRNDATEDESDAHVFVDEVRRDRA